MNVPQNINSMKDIYNMDKGEKKNGKSKSKIKTNKRMV